MHEGPVIGLIDQILHRNTPQLAGEDGRVLRTDPEDHETTHIAQDGTEDPTIGLIYMLMGSVNPTPYLRTSESIPAKALVEKLWNSSM